jgi:hypothetical protein
MKFPNLILADYAVNAAHDTPNLYKRTVKPPDIETFTA